MKLTSTSTRIGLVLALLLSAQPLRVQAATPGYSAAVKSTSRGDADGTGKVIFSVIIPAVTAGGMNSRTVKIRVDGDEKVSLATDLAAHGFDLSVGSLEDDTHSASITVLKNDGSSAGAQDILFMSPTLTFKISPDMQTNTGYVLKLGAVDPAAKTVKLTVVYPQHTFGRTLKIETRCDGGVCGTVAPVTAAVGINAGQREFTLSVGTPNSYTSTLTATLPDGRKVSEGKTVKFTMPRQSGACALGQIRYEAAAKRMMMPYTLTGTASPPRTLLVTRDGRTVGTYTDPNLASPMTIGLALEPGNTASGSLRLSTASGVLCETPYTFTAPNPDGSGGGGGNGPGTPANPGTPTGGRTPYTWLSGECISKAENLDLDAFRCVLKNSLDFMLDFLGVTATGLVVVGGFWLLSATDDKGREKGKAIMTKALIGLIIVLLAYVFVQLVLGGGIF